MSEEQTTKTTPEQGEPKAAKKPCGCSKADADKMPPVTFTTFVFSLSSSAMVHLGEVASPDTGEVAENLALAKHTIDILAMLKDKTANCLTPDESRILESALYELRMAYVRKR